MKDVQALEKLGPLLDRNPKEIDRIPDVSWLRPETDKKKIAACPQLALPILERPGGTLRDILATHLLRIRTKQGELIPLSPNRAQQAFSRTCGPRNIVLKARQVGITTWIAARFFLHTITRPGTVTVQVAHDLASAEELFRIVRRFLENLPLRLRKDALRTSRANVRQIIFPELDSEYRVGTAADPNAGRGLTIRNLHCSEVARWSGDPREALISLRAAVPPAGEIVLESTPRGAGGCFYDQWQNAAENGYVRHFFPWWWEDSYRRDGVQVLPLREDERELSRLHSLDLAQIAYRRELHAAFRQYALQEFAEDPESCFLASGECVFDVQAIEARLSSCGEPVESRDNGRLRVWFPASQYSVPSTQYRKPMQPVILSDARTNAASERESKDPYPTEYRVPSTEYSARHWIIAVDPAGGSADGDYSCAQVIERSSGLQCAELHGHFNPQELARRVAKLGYDYGTALIAVERNNHGHAVLAHLNRDGYPNVYSTLDGNDGWLTSASTRPRMIETLAAMLAEVPHLFFSKRLLEECRTFIRHADGTTGASGGAHDDCVIAMAIAQAVRAES